MFFFSGKLLNLRICLGQFTTDPRERSAILAVFCWIFIYVWVVLGRWRSVFLWVSQRKKERSERLISAFSHRKEIFCFFSSWKVETSPDLLAYDGFRWFYSLDSRIRFVIFSSGKAVWFSWLILLFTVLLNLLIRTSSWLWESIFQKGKNPKVWTYIETCFLCYFHRIFCYLSSITGLCEYKYINSGRLKQWRSRYCLNCKIILRNQ